MVLLDVNPAVRCPLLLLNVLLWFVGISLIWAALRMFMDSWDREEEHVLERLDISGLLLTHMEVLLFLFGLALFTISSCGCVGALRGNTFLLRVYSFALTILIVVNFVLGVLVYFVPDAIQRYLKCCGMTSQNFRDWNNNIYFHCDASNPSHERCSVPPSCCRPESTFTGIFCGRSVLNLSDHEACFRVHTGSCPDAANHYVKEHVMIIGGVCLVAVIVLASHWSVMFLACHVSSLSLFERRN
ncbi:hypothetical protein MRX96_050607 [Rhipicephalus microplus]